MNFKHTLMETELERGEIISVFVKSGYLDLEDYMYNPGGCVESILERLGNVIVFASAANPVRFVHYISATETETALVLQIQTGRIPEGCKASLIKNLDYSKRDKKKNQDGETQRRILLPEKSAGSEDGKSMWDQAIDALNLLKSLLSERPTTVVRIEEKQKETLRFLIYALRHRYAALIPIIQTYRPGWMDAKDEAKLKECGESYLQRADEAPAVLRLSAEYVRHTIKQDEWLTNSIMSWWGVWEHQESAAEWL